MAQPLVYRGGVVSAADYTPDIAPGAIISIFGEALAPSVLSATEVPLPDTLDGVSVEVVENGQTRKAPLFYVSPSQINAQLPFEITSSEVDVRVRNAQGVSTSQRIGLTPRNPKLFTEPRGGRIEPALVHLDYTKVTAENPALAGEWLTLFLTGLGAVNPPAVTGNAGGDDGSCGPLNRVTSEVFALVNGKQASVYFAGLAPRFVGLYQVNFQVPADLPPGDAELIVTVDNVASQERVTFRSTRGVEALASGTLGAGGGTVSGTGAKIEVPSGAFSTAGELTLVQATSGVVEDSERLTRSMGWRVSRQHLGHGLRRHFANLSDPRRTAG